MNLITASGLHRAMHCGASRLLPVVRTESHWAARGTAIHKYLEDAARVGREEALSLVPDEYRGACEVIDLDRLPVDAGAWAAEVAFAYDPNRDMGRELGRSTERDYSGREDGEITGTADLVGLTPDAVVIIDVKTGFGDLPAPDRNWQLRFLALAAARTYGRHRAVVSLLWIREGEEPVAQSAVFDDLDLDAFADELRQLQHRTDDAPTTGPWCKYCPSFTSCPAQTAMIRHAVSDTGLQELSELKPLSPQHAAVAWERIKAVRAVIKHVEAALYAYAKEQPFELPDGKVVRHTVTRQWEDLDGAVARQVLREMYGDATADDACSFSTSKAAIERALKDRVEKLAPAKREVMERIRAAGGVVQKRSEGVKEVAK